MFDWNVFLGIWLFILFSVVGIAWLLVTIGCALDQFSKRFQCTWIVINIVLVIVATIVITIIEGGAK